MKKIGIVHPFLFAISQILYVYSKNVDQVNFSEILLPVAALLGLTLALLIIGESLTDVKKAALIITIFFVLFFSFGDIMLLISGSRFGDTFIARQRNLQILLLTALFIASYFILRTRLDLRPPTKFFNMAAVVLVVINSINIVPQGINKISVDRSLKDGSQAAFPNETRNPEKKPDIYYIILDGYAGDSTLKDIYNYDNGEFYSKLKKKGFFVASESRSNYAQTWLSLSSSLNAEYINYLRDKHGTDHRSWLYAREPIRNNNVLSFLKGHGYRIIHFNSGYTLTDGNENADLEIGCGLLSEFLRTLGERTMMDDFEWFIDKDIRQRVLCTFSELAKVPDIKGPKFVFAHIVSPHPPNVFGVRGEPVRKNNKEESDWDRDYLNQLIYISDRVDSLVGEIQAKSEEPPIIILQADHGSLLTFEKKDGNSEKEGDWDNPSDLNLKERMRIFNAYYLPYGGNDLLYDGITPVNTFRVILNRYFHADFELLDDRSYFSTYDYPYGFKDVTEIVDYD